MSDTEMDEDIRYETGGFQVLVLSRKSLESVIVGGSVGFEHVLKVTVLEISHNHVKLGFDVDPTIPVYRLELYERINARPPDPLSEGSEISIE